MGALSLISGLALLVVPALLLPALLGVRGWLARSVAGLVVAAAALVLGTELLSLLDAWKRGWMLLWGLAVAACALAAWRWAGSPAPLVGWPSLRWIRNAAARNRLAAAAVAMAATALAVQAVLAVAGAPNNSDSMTYHLARIAYWLQFDSVLHFDFGSSRQLASAPNGEFLQGWVILLGGEDRLAALVQWTAGAGIAASIALGSRLLGFGRAAAAYAGSVFILLPQPLLQATTTQNDLIGAFLLVASLVLGVRGLRDGHLGELAVGAIALGLAIGTKGTTLIAGPSILLLLVAALIAYRPSRPFLIRATAIVATAIVALGAFNYVLNQRTFSDPLGPITESTNRKADSSLIDGGAQILWSFADSPGVDIPWLSTALERVGEALVPNAADPRLGFSLDTVVQEDVSSYGLFGLLALLPLLLAVLISPRSQRAWRLVAAASLLYICVFIWTSAANPWVGRVLMPAIAIGAPLIAVLYRYRLLATVGLVLAALNAIPVLVSNRAKPLLTEPGLPTVFGTQRQFLQTLNRPALRAPLDALAVELEPDAPIGLVRSDNSWDYLFFGPNRTREVTPLPLEEASRETIERRGLAAIVFADVRPPADLGAERIGEDHWLLR